MNQPSTSASASSRKERIIAELKNAIRDLSGQDQSATDATASFFDLGFDSLFLTQASQAFRNKFGVKLTFRQLLEDLVSIDAVASYLDQTMPADKLPPPAPVVAAPAEPVQVQASLAPASQAKLIPPPSAQRPAGGTVLERIMKEQLRVMAEQLELLRGGAAVAGLPAPATAASAPAKLDVSADAESVIQSGSTSVSSEPAKAEPKVFGPYRPIQKSAGGGFTERQQAFLDALIARYTQRTKKSKALTQKHRKHFSDPRTVAGFRLQWKEMVYPIVTDRSSGARVWDIDGNEYVDFVMGFGTNLLGHSPPFITAALEAQLKQGIEVGPQSPLAGPVAELMCELTGMERCAFCNTGSEAVLATIRIARTVTGRNKIVYFSGDYHGIFDEVLQRPTMANGEHRVLPVAPGIPPQHDGNVMILDYDRPESLEIIKAQGHEIAAVIVEPVQSRHPDLQPREFLRELRRITRETGSALVFDEVITGFRSHPGGVQALFDIRADLASYGKLIGGGLPIGAVCGSVAFMDALDGGHWNYGDNSIPEVGVTFFAGTYVRHPLSMAASHAILSHLKREGPQLQRQLNDRMAAAVSELNRFLRERQVPIGIEHFCSAFWVRFDSQVKHPGLLFFLLRERGIHISEGRLFFLSTAHTDADVQLLLAGFKESILAMQVGGFLPETPGELPRAAVEATAERAPSIQVEPAPMTPPRREAAPAQALPVVTPRTTEVAADASRTINFSLYFFGNYPSAYSPDKYKLLIEGSRFADQHGFTGVWIPERHFHPVGGFSPNPSVVAAAIARETTRLQLRGGSVVLPLHNPIRVAEEWSLVDNLSNGRVGIAIASGWHPNDFVFAPEAYDKRRELCTEGLALIRQLWSGQSIPVRGGANNSLDVTLYPMPVQRELPTWLTCVQKASYVTAGALGTGVLAMATNQTLEEIAGKIAAYRESFARHGHPPERAHVTLLLHTYVGADLETTLTQARGPMCDYLRSYLDNSQKRHESKGGQLDVSKDDMDFLLNRSFDDYVKGKALIGTPESCSRVVENFREIGVDEIGCFIDFGIDPEKVLASLPHLHALQQRCEQSAATNSLQPGRHGEGIDLSASTASEPRNIPLTESQQGLWALMLLTPEASRAYNESITLRCTGPLDLDRLNRALQALMDRHEALRTTIDQEGQFQTIHPRAALPISVEDFSGLSEAEQVVRLGGEFAKAGRATFDFQHGPAFRVLVIRLAPDHHLLILAFHHLFGNGPSFINAIGEICALYGALETGPAAQLEPPLQLSQYVQWQSEQEQSGETQADEAFWVKHLAEAPTTLDLPADHPRPRYLSHRGGRVSMKLDAALTAGIRKTGAAMRSSLFMTLFAAHKVWLHRLSGQRDLVVGVPFEGPARSLPGGAALFANTTNMMPLRSGVDGRTTFASLVADTKRSVLEANEHQNFFFGRLIQKLHLRPDLSRTPVFSVSFNYESGTFRQQAGGLNVELVLDEVPFGNPPDTSKFDLSVNVAEKNGELHFDCEFNADLFDQSTLVRWLEHQKTLLHGIVADPHQSIWSLPLLTDPERRRLLESWNATGQEYPRAQCLNELFEAQAAKTPEAVALEFDGQTLSYGELNRRANELARHLRGLGVVPDVLVGVCAERSIELVVGVYAVLKAGGAYVPLDPEYPKERLAFMLADAGVPVLLTQQHLEPELPAHRAQVVFLDAPVPSDGLDAEVGPPAQATPDNLAYMIYTSGSTGQPKGAMNTHRAILNRLLWKQREYHLTPEDRVLQKTPFSFDVSVWEFFWPLMCGARLIIARPGGHRDLSYLVNLICEREITTVHFVPSVLQVFLQAAGVEACTSLRRVFCGGESLTLGLQERFYARLGAELHNLYGPTEAAIDVTFWRCERDGRRRSVPIGRPLANIQMYILDAQMEPLPIGLAGELHIGGVGLARGYHRRHDLTAEKFIPHPFSAEPGARLYRTGDLARFLEDGNIEYLGRLDHQIKFRGFRIELGEIEAVLGRHPALREVVVIVREDLPGDKRLVAYAVAHAEQSASRPELRSFLEGKLPGYMIPSSFVLLDRVPLTPSGKVDRRALPSPDFSQGEGRKPFVPPRTSGEELLAEIWSALLGVKPIGRHDNFFSLGGHSLLATQIISRLRTALNVELPMRTLFEKPELAELAAAISADPPQRVNIPRSQIHPAARDRERLASFTQQQLCSVHQLKPTSAAYHIFDATRLRGALDVAALEQSLNEIVRRHAALRTTFVAREGRLVQEIHAAARVPIRFVSLTSLPETEREAAARRLAEAESQLSFDLEQGPLLRVSLLRLTELEHVLLLTMHHIVADGVSLGLFFQELGRHYAARLKGESSPLADLPVQYADFAIWQRDWLQGEFLEKQLAYWKQQLGGTLPVLDLPTDRPRARTPGDAGAGHFIRLTPALTDALKALCQQEKVTPFMLLLAAFQTLLHRYTGQEDILVGSPMANRNRPEIEELIGCFMNTVVLRVNLAGDPTFQELLQRVREVSLAAHAHQDLPFETLVQTLQPGRDPGRNPLTQVMFAFQGAPAPRPLAGLDVRPYKVEVKSAMLDLTLDLVDAEGGFQGLIEYRTDLFDAATIARMAEHFVVLLDGLVEEPIRRLSQLPLLPPAERARLLVEWNQTAFEVPADKCVHELFEAQAAKNPGAMAVRFENQTLTFGELNTRANQLAHHLIGLGVGPETLVGIFLDRSLEMLAGLLGVLKAGGAYVPLDPDYPPERLRYLLEDARAAVVLTSAKLRNSLPASPSQVILVDSDHAAIAMASGENPARQTQPDHVAYVIYTSGSTGKPKGVLVPHRALVNHNFAVIRAYELKPADRALQFASLSFDVAAEEIFPTLIAGAGVVLRTDRAIASSGDFFDEVAREAITVLNLPTMFWQGLVQAMSLGSEKLPAAVRLVIVGGEKIPTAAHEAWTKLVDPRVRWLNGYGPTETTVTATVYEPAAAGQLPLTSAVVPIGRPLGNTLAYVLDRHGQPVPIGVAGELYLGGAGVARGYLRRADLTKEKFIANPFVEDPSARLYRSGDLVRYRSDGNLEFLGRLDHQVKIRGYRVELGEIESALREHPAIRDAVVVARENDREENSLVAYAIPAQPTVPPPSEIRALLKEKLPDYMVPTALVWLEKFPTTPNGKVDARALPSPEPSPAEPENLFVRPQTPTEITLVGIWEEVLKMKRISVESDFFELGGHSLLAMRVISRINRALNIQLPMLTLFENPTIVALAVAITRLQLEQADADQIEALLREVEDGAAVSGPSGVTKT